MKIKEAYITKMPTHLFDPMPSVYVIYENGVEEKLFDFYPDEVKFKTEEFMGLTKDECLELFKKKDIRYLRS